jgi:DNA repair protein RecN (Recombination protein N)
VAKGARGGVTTADTRVLDGEERVHEVARMLGGDPESELSRAHARELLESAGATAAASTNGTRAAAKSGRRSR